MSMASRKPWGAIREYFLFDTALKTLVTGHCSSSPLPSHMASHMTYIHHCPSSLRPTLGYPVYLDQRLTHHDSIVSQLACLLDLNTLHDLSRTCRQFRANLFQYRTMLKTLTLRCENESFDPSGGSAEHDQPLTNAQLYNQKKRSGRFTSGKVGPCARDMVGECRSCSTIVCRVRRTGNADFRKGMIRPS